MIQAVVRAITAAKLGKSDLFLSLGMGFLFYGVFKIHPPSAYISVSVVLFVVAFAQSREEDNPAPSKGAE